MSKHYDYIIIGGGPCGLTIAYILSKYNKKIALIDKNDSLGGCHRVHRVDGLFSEHSPRIYTDGFKNFINILSDMNINFYDLFVKYKFSSNDILNSPTNTLTKYEYFILFMAFITLNEKYKDITVDEFITKYNFSSKSRYFMDSYCRLVDGVSSIDYPLYSLLDIVNSNIFNKIYEPIYPNDIGLFNLWKNNIENTVDICLNTDIIDIKDQHTIISKDKIYKSNNFIFAIPPYNLSKLLLRTKYKNLFGDIHSWSLKTNFLKYVSLTFHWKHNIKLEKKWGLTTSDWGIIYIVMSDYMMFNDNRSKLVISITLTRNEPSQYTENTPNQTKNRNELMMETLRQLKLIHPELTVPDFFIISNYYDKNEWQPFDSAFATTKLKYMKSQSHIYNNFYTCGHHIGESDIHYNTLESAVINGMLLCHKLIPNSIIKYPVIKSYKFLDIIKKILYLVIIIILIYYVYKF